MSHPIKTRDFNDDRFWCSKCGEIHFEYRMCRGSFEVEVIYEDGEEGSFKRTFPIMAYTFEEALGYSTFKLSTNSVGEFDMNPYILTRGVVLRIGKAGIWRSYHFKTGDVKLIINEI